jgi:uncharacterized membrane protein
MSSIGASAPLGPRYFKPVLWGTLALAFLSVLYYSDLPLVLHPDRYSAKLIHDRLWLIPHGLGGLAALLIGPLQFMTRLRQRHAKFHRIMGRIYVTSVCVAAPLALVLGLSGFGAPEPVTNAVLAAIWLGCTVCAFITARNRQIDTHRKWMIRSYVFTLNFVFTRVLNPIPAYAHLSDAAFGVLLALLPLGYLFLTELAFSWHDLTHRRGERRTATAALGA